MKTNRALKIPLFGILTAMLLIFGITQSASADLKQTNVFKAWDRNSLSMENGNVDIFWDGDHVWVYSVLGFDNDLYTTVGSDGSACGTGYSTAWAGRLELGFYHTDNAPSGAAGFTHTAEWDVVDCDFNGNGSYGNEDDTVDLNVTAPTQVATDFRVINPNVDVACQTGNCLNETVTTIFVNLDADCDGNLDANLPDDVCFVAKAFTPTLDTGPPYWAGPLQGRFTIVGGGDKTVNFNPFGPSAITLENLSSRSDFSTFMVFGGVLVVLLTSLVVLAAWRMRNEQTSV
jgi:hypothetical protein